MELVLRVEITFVLMFMAISLPSQRAIIPMSVFIGAVKTVISPFLLSFAVKTVVLEPTVVGHLVRTVQTSCCLSMVVDKIALVIGTVLENVDAFAVGTAVLKISEVGAAVRFEHATETVRTSLVIIEVTDVGVIVKTVTSRVGLRVDLRIEKP